MNVRLVLCFFVFSAASATLQADVIISGKTASVANGFTDGDHPSGSHFHSVTDHDALPAGNPGITLSSVAEVGGFFGDEEVRGISEFPVQATADIATLLFEVRDMTDVSPHAIDGLFGQGSFTGIVDVFAYEADGVESVSDFQTPTSPATPILTIDVVSDGIMAGDTLSVDVTSLYNDLVVASHTALGIRLQMSAANTSAGAISFDNFRLQLSDVTSVPEPSPVMLMGLVTVGLGGLRFFRRHRVMLA